MGSIRVSFDRAKINGLVEGLEGAPDAIQSGLKIAMTASLLQVHSTMVKPGYVPKKTGTLARSFNWDVQSKGTAVEGVIGTNLDYARIHELGGTIKPKRGKYLVFKGAQGWATVKQVVIKPKRYLTRAIQDNKKEIRDRFAKIQVLKK